jgi:hypothetical protein
MMALTLRLTFLVPLLAVWPQAAVAAAAERVVQVGDDDALRRALAEAEPGWRIVLARGTYRGGAQARGIRGTAGAPIVIEAADPKEKPVFEGGAVAMQFSGCAHLTLRNLVIRGQSGNGLNIDDGGVLDRPSHHVTLDGIHVSEVGPRGNRDAIKLSGVDDLVVRDCTVEGWGGQAIDMVGCHRGVIEGCMFRGKAGFSQDSGVQAKGGSSEITVRDCTFIDAGQRAVNLGGSTALTVFRPQGAKYEAKEIIVEGCRFAGSLSPIAFVGVDGAAVRYNTIYRPERWVVRILQETTEPGFVPSRNGRFERNLIVYERGRVRSVVNVGANTEPGSFEFRENMWFCADDAARSRPQLPTAEEGGVYGTDPKLTIDRDGAPSKGAGGAYGAGALPDRGR